MAIVNEILSGRYNRALQKLLSMKGRASLVQLAGELAPVIPFFWGAENRWVESWNRFGIGIFVAAQGVGNVAGVRIFNHPNSGVVAVIEKLNATSPGADTLTLEYLTGPATADLTPSPAFGMDLRQGTQSRSSSVFSTGNGNAGGGGVNIIGQFVVAANISYEIISTDIHEIALPPGCALNLRQQITNNTFTASAWWRERVLEDSEKS